MWIYKKKIKKNRSAYAEKKKISFLFWSLFFGDIRDAKKADKLQLKIISSTGKVPYFLLFLPVSKSTLFFFFELLFWNFIDISHTLFFFHKNYWIILYQTKKIKLDLFSKKN